LLVLLGIHAPFRLHDMPRTQNSGQAPRREECTSGFTALAEIESVSRQLKLSILSGPRPYEKRTFNDKAQGCAAFGAPPPAGGWASVSNIFGVTVA
jgi:hypothetical protein